MTGDYKRGTASASSIPVRTDVLALEHQIDAIGGPAGPDPGSQPPTSSPFSANGGRDTRRIHRPLWMSRDNRLNDRHEAHSCWHGAALCVRFRDHLNGGLPAEVGRFRTFRFDTPTVGWSQSLVPPPHPEPKLVRIAQQRSELRVTLEQNPSAPNSQTK
jgi:hypothetical protein